MDKDTFQSKLRMKLSGLPENEIDERLTFWSEIIDDAVTDEGITENEAISRLGSIDKIAEEILADIPLSHIVREKAKSNRRMKPWEIVLLSVGSPVWLSLLIAVFAVILSLYASLWAVIVSLWAVFASFIGGSVGGILSGVMFICQGNTASGLTMIAAALILAGLTILMFCGCKASTNGSVRLTKNIVLWTKKLFIKKEA